MALAVSPYASGRAGAAAISPLRSASPDRKIAGSLNQEEPTTLAESEVRRKNSHDTDARARELAGTLAKVTAGRPRSESAPQSDADTAQTMDKPNTELRREEIRQLEQIRANALYPSPATAEARSIAQLAHTQIIRAQAGLRAFELAAHQARADQISAAQFTAQRAAAAYRVLEEFDVTGLPYSA